MKNLYAPWRTEYITGTAHKKEREKSKDECVFCAHVQDNDDERHFILKRFTHTFVMMNLYPYAGGHLLVLPYAHVAMLTDLSIEVQQELIRVVSESTALITQALEAHGVNVGMNLGKAAGAGIPSHLHVHVLPRWVGDTNFLPLLANVKPISVDLVQLYRQLKERFALVSL